MRYFILAFFLSIYCFDISAQRDSTHNKVYKVNPYIDLSITAGAFAANYFGLRMVFEKPPMDSLSILSLDPNDVNWFDRPATKLNAGFAESARTISDYGMYGSFLLPVILMADRDIRKDWLDIVILYLETEAIVGNFYSWGAAMYIDRARPVVYYEDVPWEQRTGSRTMSSFYSGHTSSSAAASFFIAKVYSDYHPELGNKKYILYSCATIPPLLIGYFRYRGLKHFPSDVMVGLAVGAGTGILVPHFHKQKKSNLTVVPFTGRYTGVSLTLKL